MRTLAPIRVRTDDHPIPGDWVATCRICRSSLTAGDWAGCMVWAHGHLAFDHPRQCAHEYGWYPASRPEEHKCLDCGAALTPTGEAA